MTEERQKEDEQKKPTSYRVANGVAKRKQQKINHSASAIQTSFFLLVVLVVGARSYAPRHQSHRLAYQFVVVYVCCGCGGYALCSAKHRAVSKGTVSI